MFPSEYLDESLGASQILQETHIQQQYPSQGWDEGDRVSVRQHYTGRGLFE